MDLKAQNRALRKEILRKLFHLLELPVLFGYSVIASIYGPKFGILALTALLLILLEVEYIRLEYKLCLPAAIDILRHKEKNNVTGTIFFITSTIICFAAFDHPIALLALLITVFGDLAAALIGIKFGRTKIFRKKTLEGFSAGFLANIIVGYLFMPNEWWLFLPMALTASLVELWTGKLDDNLTVPLASGFCGQMLLFMWQSGDIPLQISFPGPLFEHLFKFLLF